MKIDSFYIKVTKGIKVLSSTGKRTDATLFSHSKCEAAASSLLA